MSTKDVGERMINVYYGDDDDEMMMMMMMMMMMIFLDFRIYTLQRSR